MTKLQLTGNIIGYVKYYEPVRRRKYQTISTNIINVKLLDCPENYWIQYWRIISMFKINIWSWNEAYGINTYWSSIGSLQRALLACLVW